MFASKNSITRRYKKLSRLHTTIHHKTNFFPGQRSGEEVQLCVRTHWVRRAIIFSHFILLGIATPGGILYLLSLINFPFFVQLILNLLLIFYLLFAWLLTFIEFIKSEMTLLVATNERIVDITQVSLFDQQISETNLDRIQEVSGHTHGILRTLLDVGRLEIQTASGEAPLVIRFVESPQLTARKILDIQKNSQQQRRTSDFRKREDDQLHGRKGENLSQEELKKMRGAEVKNHSRQRKPDQSV
ncbi:hypothetical protein KAI54_01330 [Candidatus Gracilibacteria bacterium]|nr:hypothetical protein [Candidatus Gracilibacteria bacterium]